MSDMPPSPHVDARRMRAVLLAVAALGFASVPFVVPFSGFDPQAYPVPQIDPPAQPAGYAFAIWGPIYLCLLVHAVYGLFARADDAGWDAPRWPLILSLAVGAAWLPVALMSPIWATVLIFVMLGTALAALWQTPGGGASQLLSRTPVALYAGWLTAASWVALALAGAGYGIGPGETAWAWVALGGALATALSITRLGPFDPGYAVGVVWALIAVAVTNWGSETLLAVAAVSGAVAVAASVVWPMRQG